MMNVKEHFDDERAVYFARRDVQEEETGSG